MTNGLVHQAAVAFHEHAACALGFASGSTRGAQKAVRTIVDESAANYSAYLSGHKGSLERVLAWVAAWNGARGEGGVRVYLETDGVKVWVSGGLGTVASTSTSGEG